MHVQESLVCPVCSANLSERDHYEWCALHNGKWIQLMRSHWLSLRHSHCHQR
ncbi:hypothetical protein BDA99DRAFT_518115 [Phascolomyces articulosus]|uniref:Uncharacterized protein n=1 Tax=Phascolomyces articulosus TaxID=60185 RepID=A0AAD5PB08_9FUNG|nr:hypothetical protein BDA99DRAFT_518115 [Phascolomyces articulosus]